MTNTSSSLAAAWSRRPSSLIAVLGLVGSVAVTASAANAQANLVFSGGSGTPLSLNLTAPVTYTIITAATAADPDVLFQGTGNFASDLYPGVSGTMTFTINGGAPITFNLLNSGYSGGSFAATDSYIFNSTTSVNLNVGDIIRLTSGTLTTTSNFAGAAPASGSFTTYIINGADAAGERVSSNGIAGAASAPEPGSVALLALSGLPAIGIIARRRNKVA